MRSFARGLRGRQQIRLRASSGNDLQAVETFAVNNAGQILLAPQEAILLRPPGEEGDGAAPSTRRQA